MKKRMCSLILIVLCSLFIGSYGLASADAQETNKQTETKTDNSSDEILYYSVEGEQLTIGLPYEWNSLYLGMPKDSPIFKFLGYADYDKVRTDLTAANALMVAYSGDKSKVIVVQAFEKNAKIKYKIDNLKDASENDIKSLVKNYESTFGVEIPKYEVNIPNDFPVLCCRVTMRGKSVGYADITIVDGKFYQMCVSESSIHSLDADMQKEFDDLNAIVVNNFFLGSSDTSLAEGSKAAIEGKNAKLDTEPTSGQVTQEKAKEEMSFTEKLLSGTQLFWLFPILLIVVLFARMKLAGRKKWQEEPLSLSTSKGLQGFCAVAIILHHLSQNLFYSGKATGSITFFVNIGVLMVGVFFFFSGYGLLKSYYTKENYLKGFLRKRLPVILVPFYVCNLIFILVTLAHGAKFTLQEWIVYLTGIILINSQMWYIVEIFFFYLAFFIIFRLVKNKKAAITLLGIFTLVMIALGIYRTNGNFGAWFQGEWWFNSTLLFFIGVLFCQFEEKLTKVAKKVYWLALPVAAISTILFYLQTLHMMKIDRYGTSIATNLNLLVWQVLMIITFVLTLVLICLKVKFSNPMLIFLGKIALEIYLIHNVFITYLRADIVNVKYNFVYIVLVFLYAILLASLLHPFDQKLISLISGRRKAVRAEESVSANKTEKNHFIDCWRLVAAFLVVCIHIPFPGITGAIVIAFGKTAVPFFLVVSGYFIYRDDNTAFTTRLKRQTKKIYYLFLCANLFYVIYMFILSPSSLNKAFTDKGLLTFLLYNENTLADHLWYLGSMLYALLLILLLTKLKLHKYAMFLAPVGLCAYFILSRVGNQPFYVYRNFLFVAFGYMMIGCLIRRYQNIILRVCNGKFLFLVLAVLCITNVLEYFLYRTINIPFFSAELLVYVIVLIMLKYPNIGKGTILAKLGSKCSLSIYIIHYAIIQFLQVKGFLNNSLFNAVAPFLVFFASLILAYLYQVIKERRIKL